MRTVQMETDMFFNITIQSDKTIRDVPGGENLLKVLRRNGIVLDAPCGGYGNCGKCKVVIDGREVLACQTKVDRDMSVQLPEQKRVRILSYGITVQEERALSNEGYLLAFDIGTTSIVCFLLDGASGKELSNASSLNPQKVFGADVVSRIQAALNGEIEKEASLIRGEMADLVQRVCWEAGIDPQAIRVVSVVGNPAMQQLFMKISPENLAKIPFAPVLTSPEIVPCGDYLTICSNAQMLIVPDVSGYIGADTIGCVLATALHKTDALTLMVDIGTNGEMVLGNQDRMIACSTAAGPALEGAGIHFGMRGTDGAIDHVWIEHGKIHYSVIGGGEPEGICGSGLIDAVAVLLEAGLLNKRGRIQSAAEIDGQRIIYLTEDIYLTQDDIRQVQLAKGAIRAGITLMADRIGSTVADIRHIFLAGAFGTFMNPASACRIGLLPEGTEDRITAVGNAAGSGAKLLAHDTALLADTQELVDKIEFLELASLPEFPRAFAKAMNFRAAH